MFMNVTSRSYLSELLLSLSIPFRIIPAGQPLKSYGGFNTCIGGTKAPVQKQPVQAVKQSGVIPEFDTCF